MTNETLEELANEGNADAQFELGFKNYRGVELFHGKRLDVDLKKAISWFTLAAESNHPKALYYLGRMYENGEAVKSDHNKAINYYQQSSKAGFGAASVHLGLYYDAGKFVNRNLEKAFQYFELAISQGEMKANFYKGKYLLDGQLKSGQNVEEGIRCIQISAENGFSAAQSDLAVLFMDGVETLQNYEKGIYWLTQAAINDDQKAQNKLANCYYNGIGVDVDMNAAYGWWRRAAEPLNGSPPSALALLNCGICNMTGKGAEKDNRWAEIYLSRAAKLKVPQAQYCLAILYRDNGHKIHSHAWFNIASTGKHEKAIKERNFIEKSMSSDDVKEAQRMAEAISRDQMTDLILT